MKKYDSTGYVYGTLWGGGKGVYPAKKISADSKDELLNIANKMLKNTSLDNGMGFESLIGAMLLIRETESILINNKQFNHEEFCIEFIGDLTEIEQRYLKNRL